MTACVTRPDWPSKTFNHGKTMMLERQIIRCAAESQTLTHTSAGRARKQR